MQPRMISAAGRRQPPAVQRANSGRLNLPGLPYRLKIESRSDNPAWTEVVSSLLGVANRWGADAGFKYYHDYSGIVFFLSALALLLLFSWLLGCREIREDIF